MADQNEEQFEVVGPEDTGEEQFEVVGSQSPGQHPMDTSADVREPGGAIAPINPAPAPERQRPGVIVNQLPIENMQRVYNEPAQEQQRPGVIVNQLPIENLQRVYDTGPDAAQAPAPAQVPVPTPAPAPAPQPQPSPWDTAKTLGSAALSAALPSGTGAALGAVDAAGNALHKGIVRPLQDLAAPVLEKGVQAQGAINLFSGKTPEQAAIADQLTRDALSYFGGEKLKEGHTPFLQSGKQLMEEHIGETGTTLIRDAASSLPLFVLNPGLGVRGALTGRALATSEKLAAEAPLLGRLLQGAGQIAGGAAGGAAEGAGQGLVASLLTGQSPVKGAGQGAIGGALFGGALNAKGAFKKTPPVSIGFLTEDGNAKIAQEIDDLLKSPEPIQLKDVVKSGKVAEPLGGPATSNEKVGGSTRDTAVKGAIYDPRTEVYAGGYRAIAKAMGEPVEAVRGPPGVAMIAQKADGSFEGRLVDLSADGVPSKTSHPIGTAADMAEFVRKAGAQDLEILIPSGVQAEFEQSVSPEVRAALRGGAEGKSSLPSVDAPAVPEINRPANVVAVSNRDGTQTIRILRHEATPEETPTQPGNVNDPMIRHLQSGGEVGGGSGPPKPSVLNAEEPQAVQLTQADTPAAKAAELNDIVGFAQAANDAKKKGMLGRLANMWVADIQRGSVTVRQMKLLLAGAKNLGKIQDPLLQAMRKELPNKSLLDAAANDLGAVARGKMDMRALSAKHPEIGAGMQKVFDAALSEIRQNSKTLEQLGYIPEGLSALRDQGLVEQYVAQVYHKHLMGKGQWGDIALKNKDLMNEGAEFLRQAANRQGLKWNKEQISAELMRLLGADNPQEAFYGSPMSKPFNQLKKREELPPTLAKLFGQVESGPIRVAYTLAKQRQLMAQLGVFNEVAADPRFTSPTAKPGWIAVDKSPQWGNLGGQYLHPDMESLTHAPKLSEHIPSLLEALGLNYDHAIGGWVKANLTVRGGVGNWVSNFMRNIKGGLFSGGVEPWRPDQAGQSFREAWAALREFDKNPASKSDGARWTYHGVRTGAISQGFASNELASPAIINELEAAFSKDPEGGLYSIHSAMRKVMTAGKHVDEKLKYGYDFIDRVWKMQSFIALTRKFAGQGMAPEQAMRMASIRINDSFPNFEHVGKAVEAVRRAPIGAMAPFFSGETEDLRTNINAVAKMAGLGQERMGPRDLMITGRLLGGALISSALYGGVRAVRHMRGITDDDVDEALAVRSKQSQVYHTGLLAAPWRDGDGQVHFIDMSRWTPELQLLQGHPNDPTITRILTNLALTPVRGGAFEQLGEKMFQGMGVTTPTKQYQTPPALPGATAWETASKILQFGGNSGLVPGAINKLATDVSRRASAPKGPATEGLTTGEIVRRAAGVPEIGHVTLPSEVPNSPTRIGGALEAKTTVDQLRTQARSIAHQMGSGQISKEQGLRALQAIQQKMSNIGTEQTNINNLVEKRRKEKGK